MRNSIYGWQYLGESIFSPGNARDIGLLVLFRSCFVAERALSRVLELTSNCETVVGIVIIVNTDRYRKSHKLGSQVDLVVRSKLLAIRKDLSRISFPPPVYNTDLYFRTQSHLRRMIALFEIDQINHISGYEALQKYI